MNVEEHEELLDFLKQVAAQAGHPVEPNVEPARLKQYRNNDTKYEIVKNESLILCLRPKFLITFIYLEKCSWQKDQRCDVILSYVENHLYKC